MLVRFLQRETKTPGRPGHCHVRRNMTAILPLILVVDDNPWFREFLDDLLSLEGYRVVAVEPGEALAAASTEPPALAVLDAVMPGMDGPSLCRQLREVDATRD